MHPVKHLAVTWSSVMVKILITWWCLTWLLAESVVGSPVWPHGLSAALYNLACSLCRYSSMLPDFRAFALWAMGYSSICPSTSTQHSLKGVRRRHKNGTISLTSSGLSTMHSNQGDKDQMSNEWKYKVVSQGAIGRCYQGTTELCITYIPIWLVVIRHNPMINFLSTTLIQSWHSKQSGEYKNILKWLSGIFSIAQGLV